MPKCTNCQDDYKCILHREKDDEWMNNESNISEFWKKIREELFDSLVKRKDIHIFKNITFPKYEQDKSSDPQREPINYSDDDVNFTTKGKVTEHNQSIRLDNEENNDYETPILHFTDISISFEACIFFWELDLSIYDFKNKISFSDNCIFKEGIKFNTEYKASVTIDNCSFEDKEIDLSSRTFNAGFYLKNSRNISMLNCSSMVCSIGFSLKDTTVDKSNFTNTRFKGRTVFLETTFIDEVDFKYTTFDKLVLFRKTTFSSSVNLEDTFINDRVDFLGMKNKNGKKLESENIFNRETARIIKHSFEEQDNIIEANKFYALEMEKERASLKFRDFPAEWLIFQIHSLSSNHSQSWILPLLWIFIIGLLAYFIGGEDLDKVSLNLNIDIFIASGIFFILPIGIIVSSMFNKIEQGLAIPLFCYLFFNFFINDKTSIDQLAQQISPFSKLGTDMTAIDFIAKVIIAYLIYQFVVSVRQNTRRT